MTTRLVAPCLTTVFLIVASSLFVQAQVTAPSDTSTLKGIRTVYVLIEDLPDGAKVLGLSGDAIQTDVELRLRLAGIHVVTQEEGLKLPGAPHLYVNVNLTDDARALGIDVQLAQNVLLERNSLFVPSAATWSKGFTGENPTAQIIRDRIKDLVDMFLNDWLSVNPKK
ncbi:MAG: hypothetical protein ACLP1Y_10475 [Candidatus Acidiferrales bacterium]